VTPEEMNLADQINNWFSECFYTFDFIPGIDTGVGAEKAVIENFLVDVFTKLIISLCTAWWSIREIVEYFQNRKILKEIIPDGKPNLS